MALATAWDLRKLQKHLQKRVPGNLFLVYGEESYLVDESVKLLKEKTLKEGAVDFNYDLFYVPDADANQIRDAVETLPMMCPRRLVIVKNAHLMREKDWEKLQPVIEDPIDTAVFILVAEKVDKRKKHIKSIFQKGTVVELKRPYDNQMPQWIEYIAQAQGIQLHREALSLVHQFVGGNLSEINSEMLKLKTYLGDRTEATTEDILNLISKARINSIFDLTNAIGSNDRAQALSCLANLLEHGQNEVGALALISRHIRILNVIKTGVKEGVTGSRLSAKAGVPQYFLKEYLNQARSWSQSKLEKTIQALHETDRALKSSPVSSHIWLENFIIKTCRP